MDPRDALEAAAALRFPTETDARLQELMDRNTEGRLTPDESKELASLAAMSETLSLVRGKALLVLGHQLQVDTHA